MVRGLIGKKLGMTSLFTPDGRHVPVTVVQVGPCVVTQIKKDETDGYRALQLGFGAKKETKTTKPLKGHFRKSGEAVWEPEVCRRLRKQDLGPDFPRDEQRSLKF